MRLASAVLDPNDPKLLTGTPEEQRQARREWQAARTAQAIIQSKEEIPRSRLLFSRYWIEDEQTGNLYRPFSGDPDYAPTVRHYYVDSVGNLIMLEPADPPSRTELERRQARKAQRRLDQEAVAKQRRAQLRALKR